MPTLLSCARRIGDLFRIASGGEPGSVRVLLLLLMLWASVSGVTATEPLGPSPVPAESAGDEGAGADREDTSLPLAVGRLVPLDMTEGAGSPSEPDNLKTLGPAVSPDGRYI